MLAIAAALKDQDSGIRLLAAEVLGNMQSPKTFGGDSIIENILKLPNAIKKADEGNGETFDDIFS